jgi:hypothetical protein
MDTDGCRRGLYREDSYISIFLEYAEKAKKSCVFVDQFLHLVVPALFPKYLTA